MDNLTDQERAAFIGYANLAGLVFTGVFYAGAYHVGRPYYNPALIPAHVAVGFCLFILMSFFLLLNNAAPFRRGILRMAGRTPQSRNGATAESFGWVLTLGITVDFIVMGGLVGLTGGTIESLFSPYILTMIVIGQFLTPRTSMKILLGIGGTAIYAAILSPEWMLSVLNISGGIFTGTAFGNTIIRGIYFSVFVVSLLIATVVSIFSTQKSQDAVASPPAQGLEAQ